jgi:hypothetical protein
VATDNQPAACFPANARRHPRPCGCKMS